MNDDFGVKPVGRIIVRNGAVGLFFPTNGGLEEGIYDITSMKIPGVIDELQMKYVGKTHLGSAQLNGFDLNGLMACRPSSCMTTEELIRAGQLEEPKPNAPTRVEP